jgi:hypothetical protein
MTWNREELLNWQRPEPKPNTTPFVHLLRADEVTACDANECHTPARVAKYTRPTGTRIGAYCGEHA